MDENMTNKPRVAKVLVTLLISMTVGTVILLALNGNAPSAGPFSLSSYHRLDPVAQAIASKEPQVPSRWNCIEIYYSNTKAGNAEQLASLNGLASSEDLNCHFVVCNGLGGGNGQIQSTQKWQKQWSVIPGNNWYGTDHTIRICVIADGKTSHPTDFQIKRVESLVESLSRKFEIGFDSVYYPIDWR